MFTIYIIFYLDPVRQCMLEISIIVVVIAIQTKRYFVTYFKNTHQTVGRTVPRATPSTFLFLQRSRPECMYANITWTHTIYINTEIWYTHHAGSSTIILNQSMKTTITMKVT